MRAERFFRLAKTGASMGASLVMAACTPGQQFRVELPTCANATLQSEILRTHNGKTDDAQRREIEAQGKAPLTVAEAAMWEGNYEVATNAVRSDMSISRSQAGFLVATALENRNRIKKDLPSSEIDCNKKIISAVRDQASRERALGR